MRWDGIAEGLLTLLTHDWLTYLLRGSGSVGLCWGLRIDRVREYTNRCKDTQIPRWRIEIEKMSFHRLAISVFTFIYMCMYMYMYIPHYSEYVLHHLMSIHSSYRSLDRIISDIETLPRRDEVRRSVTEWRDGWMVWDWDWDCKYIVTEGFDLYYKMRLYVLLYYINILPPFISMYENINVKRKITPSLAWHYT